MDDVREHLSTIFLPPSACGACRYLRTNKQWRCSFRQSRKSWTRIRDQTEMTHSTTDHKREAPRAPNPPNNFRGPPSEVRAGLERHCRDVATVRPLWQPVHKKLALWIGRSLKFIRTETVLPKPPHLLTNYCLAVCASAARGSASARKLT